MKTPTTGTRQNVRSDFTLPYVEEKEGYCAVYYFTLDPNLPCKEQVISFHRHVKFMDDEHYQQALHSLPFSATGLIVTEPGKDEIMLFVPGAAMSECVN